MTVVTTVTDGVPSSSNTAIMAALQSINEQEVDIIWAGQSASPFLTTLMAAGREMNKVLDSTERFNSIGLSEKYWNSGATITHYEQDELLRNFTVNGAINSGSTTTIVLDSTLGLKKYDLLRVVSGSTNEVLWISSVTNATDIVVVRGFGSSSAAAIADDAVLLRFSSSVPAGVAGVDDVKVLAEARTNYVQKFVDTLSGNDFDDLARTYVAAKNKGKARDYWLSQKIADHKKSLEFTALFGQKKDSFSANGVYGMEGVIELAKRGNQADYSSGLTKADLSEAIGEVSKYGMSDKKYAFCGTKAMAEIADLFDANQYLVDGIKEYSVQLNKFTIPNGQNVKFLQHPLFDDMGLSGHMLIVDMSQLNVVWAKGNGFAPELTTGQTRVIPRPTNTYASFNIDIVTYMSMQNKNARAHGLFKLA
jgi:hypothetical protein